MNTYIYKLATIVTIFSLLIVGCTDDEKENPITPTLAKANVKVVHASPDAPAVDLLLDNTIAGTNLSFPNNTGYLSVDEGTRNVKVRVSGTSTTVIDADLNIEANKNYSIFAVDAVANLAPLVIDDDLTLPASGNSHVRFIHLSPDAPAVDITTTDGTILFGNYNFKDYSNFTPIPAGNYDLEVRIAGTQTVVLSLSGISVSDGNIYTIFAKGFVSGTNTQSLGAQIIINN